MKTEELRKQFADENKICISDCKFIPETDSKEYIEWLEQRLIAWSSHTLSKEEPKDSGWISVEDRLPEDLESVWISNGKGWTSLGCMHDYGDGWCWAESNGVIYQEGDKIVVECEADDLDVKFWMPLPDPPTVETKKD